MGQKFRKARHTKKCRTPPVTSNYPVSPLKLTFTERTKVFAASFRFLFLSLKMENKKRHSTTNCFGERQKSYDLFSSRLPTAFHPRYPFVKLGKWIISGVAALPSKLTTQDTFFQTVDTFFSVSRRLLVNFFLSKVSKVLKR